MRFKAAHSGTSWKVISIRKLCEAMWELRSVQSRSAFALKRAYRKLEECLTNERLQVADQVGFKATLEMFLQRRIKQAQSEQDSPDQSEGAQQSEGLMDGVLPVSAVSQMESLIVVQEELTKIARRRLSELDTIFDRLNIVLECLDLVVTTSSARDDGLATVRKQVAESARRLTALMIDVQAKSMVRDSKDDFETRVEKFQQSVGTDDGRIRELSKQEASLARVLEFKANLLAIEQPTFSTLLQCAQQSSGVQILRLHQELQTLTGEMKQLMDYNRRHAATWEQRESMALGLSSDELALRADLRKNEYERVGSELEQAWKVPMQAAELVRQKFQQI